MELMIRAGHLGKKKISESSIFHQSEHGRSWFQLMGPILWQMLIVSPGVDSH